LILVFGNIPNIFCSIFQGVSFNYHQGNVRSPFSVSSFQVSVSAFMAKSRSRSLSQVSVSEVTVSTTSLAADVLEHKRLSRNVMPVTGGREHVLLQHFPKVVIAFSSVSILVYGNDHSNSPIILFPSRASGYLTHIRQGRGLL